MARQRCFSTEIISSKNFIDMPLSAHALYFHLIGNADDDGIVNAERVMSYDCKASRDDLILLHTKGFVRILETDSLITYIDRWIEFNKLDRRYKKDSIHQQLLVNVYPDVEIIPEMKDKRRRVRAKDVSSPNQGTTNDRVRNCQNSRGQLMGNTRVAHGNRPEQLAAPATVSEGKGTEENRKETITSQQKPRMSSSDSSNRSDEDDPGILSPEESHQMAMKTLQRFRNAGHDNLRRDSRQCSGMTMTNGKEVQRIGGM